MAALSTLTVLVLPLGYRTPLACRVEDQTTATADVTPGRSGWSGGSSAASVGDPTVTGPVARTEWEPVQGARSDMVGGATVTTTGDVPALQAAPDRAGL